MDASFAIVDAAPLMPGALSELTLVATAEGVGNVQRVIDEWINGSQRYERPGERMLLAQHRPGSIVAIGGLSQCPHVPGALRMRRFYTDPSWRRQGVATEIAARLIRWGFEHTREFTCNAQASPGAARFWEALGFCPVDLPGITHHRLAGEALEVDERGLLIGAVAVRRGSARWTVNGEP